MNLIKKLFQQRKAFLANGTEIKEGDEVSFVNSDGIKCTDKIKRREDGTLFFWNNGFSIEDYSSAEKVSIT
jgi:hypothetical protein